LKSFNKRKIYKYKELFFFLDRYKIEAIQAIFSNEKRSLNKVNPIKSFNDLSYYSQSYFLNVFYLKDLLNREL